MRLADWGDWGLFAFGLTMVLLAVWAFLLPLFCEALISFRLEELKSLGIVWSVCSSVDTKKCRCLFKVLAV